MLVCFHLSLCLPTLRLSIPLILFLVHCRLSCMSSTIYGIPCYSSTSPISSSSLSTLFLLPFSLSPSLACFLLYFHLHCHSPHSNLTVPFFTCRIWVQDNWVSITVLMNRLCRCHRHHYPSKYPTYTYFSLQHTHNTWCSSCLISCLFKYVKFMQYAWHSVEQCSKCMQITSSVYLCWMSSLLMCLSLRVGSL